MTRTFLGFGLLLFATTFCPAATRERGQPELPLPADVNTAVTSPCSEVWGSTSAPSSAMRTALSPYRVLGGEYLDRMAYLFRTEAAADCLRLTITYPDDAPRNAEIYYFSEKDNSFGMTGFGTGYFTGDPYPLTDRMIEQVFYFFAPSQKFAIVFMTAANRRPAAVARIRLEKVDLAAAIAAQAALSSKLGRHTPTGTVSPTKHGTTVFSNSGRRKLGMYWEDEVFQQNFAELSVRRMSSAEQAAAFLRALERHVAYMKLIGNNLVIDPEVWYDSALYRPSAEYHPTRWTGEATMRPPDFDRWMAKRYCEEGFDFWPSIRSWNLPSLADWVKPEADVRSGAATEYVNTVDKDGKVIARSAWHNPPMLNALHPRVQAALKNLVTEIMDRLSPYESVKGIVLWATIHSVNGLGTPDQSYDDYTVRAFASDAGLQMPPLPTPPDGRFQQWYQWLHGRHEDAWIAWRKKKVTELYSGLAEIVARKKPGAKLNVMVLYPSPTMNVGRTVDDVGAYLDSVGLDIEALSHNPN